MTFVRRNARVLGAAATAAALTALLGVATAGPQPAAADGGGKQEGEVATVKMFSPEEGHRAGIGCRGWFVDLEVAFDGVPLEKTGFEGLQITGPAGHNNVAPLPGTFSMGQDDRFKGLIVLVSTNGAGAGSNVANLFNVTGVTDRTDDEVEIWDTWIVGAANFGCDTNSTVYTAIAADKDGNGVYDDAPNVVPDADGDGDVDKKDLKAFGLASNVKKVDFFISS